MDTLFDLSAFSIFVLLFLLYFNFYFIIFINDLGILPVRVMLLGLTVISQIAVSF